MRLALVAALALALVPAARAGTTTTTNPATQAGTATTTNPLAPPSPVPGELQPQLTTERVTRIFLRDPKVASWLKRYPKNPVTQATFSKGDWTVNVYSGNAGEIATGTVSDSDGTVVEAWTGAQVAWRMARGYPGAFGGTKINSYPVWLGFCAAFLVGLVDWRRPLSLRNLDLLALLAFSVPLWFFNHGHVFASASLVVPVLVWLLVRCIWVAFSDRPARGATVWPVWVLAAATVFLAGFRIGLDVRASNVIDVGYSGVIGAERIVHEGQSPYGHFPQEDNLPKCGPPDGSGEVRDRIQTNGRCENANPLGDTYGPVAYLAYVPGYLAFGWSGMWDSLPAVKATTIGFDLLALVGLALVGRRFGGPRLAATLAFAWAAWPFTQYAASSNTNDTIGPVLLVFGFLLVTSDVGRGVFAALSGWTKFASLIVAPLWSGYPEARRPRTLARYWLAFAVATLAVFFVLLLEPSPLHAARVFWDRTIGFQTARSAPWSIWDWRQYHAKGLPNLHLVQQVLEVALVVGAVACAWWPRVRSPLRLAALTAALLIGFQLVLTYWIYLYLPWFFPFAALALVAAPGARPGAAPAGALDDDDSTERALVAA
ncbi:MAG TPA: hypothetical protein VHC45_02350 [Gaiellaceae bacterium]|nr:hypothetical protein [Gaiellaceae bacterium]